MNDGVHNELRSLTRTHTHEIWKLAKNGELEHLSAEDRQLGEILLEHEDEFYHHFEFTDAVADYDYEPGTEVNPFLHITIHTVVENQLEAKDPIEAFQFYNAMRKKHLSHHETIHLIGSIFAPLMFDVLKQGKPFDSKSYTSLLKKYKRKKPERIPAALDKDLESLFG